MENHFIVKYPKGFGILFGLLVAITAFICAMLSIINGIDPLMYISFTLLLLPFAFALIWFRKYKIVVNEDIITVHRGFGPKYTIKISDITKIKWVIRRNPFANSYQKTTKRLIQHNQLTAPQSEEVINENIIIKTKKRHFAASTPMDGFEKFSKYLKDYVDINKISFK